MMQGFDADYAREESRTEYEKELQEETKKQ